MCLSQNHPQTLRKPEIPSWRDQTHWRPCSFPGDPVPGSPASSSVVAIVVCCFPPPPAWAYFLMPGTNSHPHREGPDAPVASWRKRHGRRVFLDLVCLRMAFSFMSCQTTNYEIISPLVEGIAPLPSRFCCAEVWCHLTQDLPHPTALFQWMLLPSPLWTLVRSLLYPHCFRISWCVFRVGLLLFSLFSPFLLFCFILCWASACKLMSFRHSNDLVVFLRFSSGLPCSSSQDS